MWAMSVCSKSDTPSVESGHLLSMIMDSGGEEHVVSLADWRRLGVPLLKPAHASCTLAQCLCVTIWKFLAVLLCVDGVRTNWWS